MLLIFELLILGYLNDGGKTDSTMVTWGWAMVAMVLIMLVLMLLWILYRLIDAFLETEFAQRLMKEYDIFQKHRNP